MGYRTNCFAQSCLEHLYLLPWPLFNHSVYDDEAFVFQSDASEEVKHLL